MRQTGTPLSESRRRRATTAALVTVCWMFAAALVFLVHAELDPISWWAGPVARIAWIVLSAYAYTRLCARHADISHALEVGSAWLAFGIVAELAMTRHLGRGWFTLLGSPDHPLLRSVFLSAWVFAPVLFVRREGRNVCS